MTKMIAPQARGTAHTIPGSRILDRPVNLPHVLFGHAFTVDRDFGERRFDLTQVRSRQLDIDAAGILGEVIDVACAGNRHNERLLRQQPGNRHCDGVAFFFSAWRRSNSTTGMFAARFSGEKRGNSWRKSVFGSNRVLPFMVPVR
jgi:hypothetical protein